MTEPSPVSENRIRERAYLLWLEEGQPLGKEAEHWERARELLALEPDIEGEPEVVIDGYRSAPNGASADAAAQPDEFPAAANRKTPKKRRPSVAKKRPM